MKLIGRLAAPLLLFALLLALHGAALVLTVRAQGDEIVVQPPCDEDALDVALIFVKERAGGTITFNCGGPTAINVTTAKTIELPTKIDGAGQITLNGGNGTRLFYVEADGNLTLSRLTLTRGFSPGDGGAIANYGTLNIDRSTIQNSNATGSGGAIVSYGPLNITASTFTGNSAANAGAIFPRFPGATTIIVDSSLRANHATSPVDGWGGAILAWDGANVIMYGGTIEDNSARAGGGIHNRFANSTITLTDVVVSGNLATDTVLKSDVNGGGLFNSAGRMYIYNSVISGNDAAWVGGGLYNAGTVTIDGSVFTGNTALADGGGLANVGTATITGALFHNNSSGDNSGLSNRGTVTIQNATFSGNVVQEDGVLGNYGAATIQNTTFSDNIDISGQSGASTIVHASQQSLRLKNVVLKLFAGGFGGVNCSVSNLTGDVPIASDGFNLSDDISCAPYFTKAGDKNNTDPQLGPLADNGGSSRTHLPLPDSPLIDGGQCIAGISADQRGVARPQGAACDIGAVEVRSEEQMSRLFVPLVRR